jgi:hypothetical protein
MKGIGHRRIGFSGVNIFSKDFALGLYDRYCGTRQAGRVAAYAHLLRFTTWNELCDNIFSVISGNYRPDVPVGWYATMRIARVGATKSWPCLLRDAT